MLQSFLSFDKLIGTKLIGFLYFLGLLVILLALLKSIFSGFGAMRFSVGTGLGTIIGAFFAALIAVVFWRFMCETFILLFRISEDLREIKNRKT